MRTLGLAAVFALCGALQAQVAVVNGASFRGDQPLAAGSWAAAFGNFANVATITSSASPIPSTLGGVTVTIGGVAAPLYYVSNTQLVFLIPYAVTPGLRPVEVRTGSGTVSGNVRVMTAAPGLFTKETQQAIPPKGAVLNQDSTENTASVPARRGQIVQIFGTGPGAVSATVADGAPAPAQPLASTRSTPQVYIGGIPATVQFSGLTPGVAGVWQINAFVPERTVLRGRVPVQVFMDGVDSNEVAIFVAQ